MTDDLTARLQRVADELEIRNLVARYVFAIDDRDLATVADLFAPDGVFRSVDGVMNARGRETVVEQFKGRYSVLGASNHVTHDHLVTVHSPTRATGLVSAHAELWRKGEMMVTALRYADTYVRTDGAWRFAERTLSFLYYAPLSEYRDILGRRNRNLAYDEPKPADYPEGLPTWADYG
jgi:uncharacterized protein (TIGR02246 family)